MSNLTLHMIVNPQAGSGNASKTLEEAKTILNKKQITYHSYLTEYPGHEKKIAKELKESILTPWNENQSFSHLLLVIGGDGTLHEVTNTLADSPDIPIAYLPAGSGNDFARGLSLSRKTKQDLNQILETKQPTSVQLIATEFKEKEAPELVLNNIGIGLDAHIVHTANHSQAKNWLNKFGLGSLAYLASVFSVLKKQKAFPISFQVGSEQKKYPNAYLCTITNHPFFGGGIAIDPTASIKETRLSVVLLEKVNIFIIFYLVSRLLLKKHLNSKYIHHFKAEELTLSSTLAEYCQTDGEIVGKMPQEIHCQMTTRLFWV